MFRFWYVAYKSSTFATSPYVAQVAIGVDCSFCLAYVTLLPVQHVPRCSLLVPQHKPCAPGGMLPLSATLATNSVFDAFQDSSKLKALLHGHSYTAHAIGCSAAVTALDLYLNPETNPNLQLTSEITGQPCLRPLWNEELVDQLSRHDRVQKVVALGTACLATCLQFVCPA